MQWDQIKPRLMLRWQLHPAGLLRDKWAARSEHNVTPTSQLRLKQSCKCTHWAHLLNCRVCFVCLFFNLEEQHRNYQGPCDSRFKMIQSLSVKQHHFIHSSSTRRRSLLATPCAPNTQDTTGKSWWVGGVKGETGKEGGREARRGRKGREDRGIHGNRPLFKPKVNAGHMQTSIYRQARRTHTHSNFITIMRSKHVINCRALTL